MYKCGAIHAEKKSPTGFSIFFCSEDSTENDAWFWKTELIWIFTDTIICQDLWKITRYIPILFCEYCLHDTQMTKICHDALLNGFVMAYPAGDDTIIFKEEVADH